jgi:hypothetical protein
MREKLRVILTGLQKGMIDTSYAEKTIMDLYMFNSKANLFLGLLLGFILSYLIFAK